MPAKTPDTVIRESMGSLTLTIAEFTTANIDTNDTYTSNVPSVVAWWAQANDSPTTNTMGIDVDLTTPATGVFTFYTGSENRLIRLFILARN